MGRNGAGKSTMLKAIMGLVPVTAGTITLDGDRIDRHFPPTRFRAKASATCPKAAASSAT